MGNALSIAFRIRFRNLMDGGLRAAAASPGNAASQRFEKQGMTGAVDKRPCAGSLSG